jgi:GMP synthase (glutamine-hydrolysing)
MSSITRPKRILLVDAVVWSEAYPQTSPYRDVHRWYARWFEDLPGISLACTTPERARALVEAGTDGLILSGSPRDAWNDDPVNAQLCEVVKVCQHRSIPFLGVCYGHQVLARALGGVVQRHPGGLELGNTPVRVTAAGHDSPLLAGLPDAFPVLSSHVDAVVMPAPETELLLQGEFTENQGFHWKELLYGVQFHPETDPDILRFIWNPRRESWRARVSYDLDKVLDGLQPTPWAGQILRNFATKVLP